MTTYLRKFNQNIKNSDEHKVNYEIFKHDITKYEKCKGTKNGNFSNLSTLLTSFN